MVVVVHWQRPAGWGTLADNSVV